MLKANLEQSLRKISAPDQILTDLAEMIPYEIDSALERGTPDAVVFPRTTEEISRLARWAFQNNVPLVGRGAGTGRSGGAVAEHGGIIIEFSQMDRLIDFNPAARIVVVEPGMINLTLDNIVKAKGLYYPPDPSSGRAATLGGNVAENAGGPHCFKYGVTTKYITALEIVLADGRVIQLGGDALDAPEYDFCGLVTGSEGTLCLISKIQARLLRQPIGVQTMMAAFDSIRTAGDAVSAVIAAGLVPATLEMMDQRVMRLVEEFVHPGLPVNAGAMLIVEVDGYPTSLSPQIDEIARILEQHGAFDLRVARTAEERNAIWYGRKSAGSAYPHFTVDSTVPRSRIAETLDAANEICERHGLRVGHVFHAGDGNLHPSILVDASEPEEIARVMQAAGEILEQVVMRDGAISGEHGIGIEKREYMPLMFNDAELSALWDVKQVFDPTNILNPGKIFPSKMPAYSKPELSDAVPGNVFIPATAEEAARGLAALSARNRRVNINRRVKDAVTLETSALTGIKKFAPDDLYIQVGAGIRLGQVQKFLGEHNRQVALVAPWSDTTVGGLVAANVNSPQRLLYGSIRDQLLAATVVLPDGRIIRAGRPVVKNVAGYDLPKVFVGSFGTLGLIVDVTLKLFPRPRGKRTLLMPIDKLETGLELGKQLLSHARVASAIVLSKGINIPEISSRYILAYTAEGVVEEVESELVLVRDVVAKAGARFVETSDVTGTDLWCHLFSRGKSTLQMRIGVPPQRLVKFVQEQSTLLHHGSFLIDIANSLLYTNGDWNEFAKAKDWIKQLRQPALAANGYGVVMTMPEKWMAHIDWCGYRPESYDLTRELKARWDPANISSVESLPAFY